MRVMLGKAAVKLAAEFSRQSMRRVLSIRDQRRAVQRGRRDEMSRVSPCRAHHITATHAKTDGSHAAAPHSRRTVKKLQDCAGIVQNHLVGEFWPCLDLAEFLPFEPIDRDDLILFVSEPEM